MSRVKILKITESPNERRLHAENLPRNEWANGATVCFYSIPFTTNTFQFSHLSAFIIPFNLFGWNLIALLFRIETKSCAFSSGETDKSHVQVQVWSPFQRESR